MYFGVNSNRRRAYGIDLSRTDLVSPDDFPQEDRQKDRGSGWESRYWD